MTKNAVWRAVTSPIRLTYALGILLTAFGMLAWGLANEDCGSDVGRPGEDGRG